MSELNHYNLRINYETNKGKVLAEWISGKQIKINFEDLPSLDFEIPTQIPGFDFSSVEPTIKSLQRESMLELLLRIQDIYFFSATFASEVVGELDLVLDRGNESNDVICS